MLAPRKSELSHCAAQAQNQPLQPTPRLRAPMHTPRAVPTARVALAAPAAAEPGPPRVPALALSQALAAAREEKEPAAAPAPPLLAGRRSIARRAAFAIGPEAPAASPGSQLQRPSASSPAARALASARTIPPAAMVTPREPPRSARRDGPAAAPGPQTRAPLSARGPARGGGGGGGGVDVTVWLRERKEREAARASARWARVHQDARFIERLERSQEVRNAALAADEERRRAAEAAAANWQSVPFQPLHDADAPLAGDAASEEERLLRLDASRIFGVASITPRMTLHAAAAASQRAAEAAPRSGGGSVAAASPASPPAIPPPTPLQPPAAAPVAMAQDGLLAGLPPVRVSAATADESTAIQPS